jgi:hypothetical protein
VAVHREAEEFFGQSSLLAKTQTSCKSKQSRKCEYSCHAFGLAGDPAELALLLVIYPASRRCRVCVRRAVGAMY